MADPALAAPPPPCFENLAPVERVAGLSPRDFNARYVRPHRPVVIQGVASDWPACTKWTPEFFKARFPTKLVPVEVWEGEEHQTDPAGYLKQVKRVEMEWGKYVDLCREGATSSKRHYLAQYPIFQTEPDLRADVGSLEPYFDIPSLYPAALRRRLIAPPLLWSGPGGTVSTLHFDMYQNLFVQLGGRKRFTLVSPDQSDLLYYPDKRFGLFASFSPIDIERPDFSRHPLAKQVRALECVVEPGEMLFIPLGWWHHVRSFEPSTSMNFWWWPVVRTLVAGRRHILHSLRTILSGSAKPRL